jgi:Tfp pilus assembly protein PilF
VPGRVHADAAPAAWGWRAALTGRLFGPALAILGLCAAVYFPLHAAGFTWDDGYWITGNPLLHRWADLGVIWFQPGKLMQYYPLSVTAYFLQWQSWGSDPIGYHIVSILLQAINAIVLWRILLRLRLRGAWVAAAIFAIEPVAVESVAWVVEQKNLISGLLVLAAVWAWIRFAALDGPPDPSAGQQSAYDWKFYGAASLFYLLALLAKTYVCALPAAILVLTWWKLGRITIKHIIAIAPWFALTAGAGWMAAWRERTGAGAHGAAYHFSISQHLVIAGKDLWFYAGKLLWPHPLLMVYPRWHVHAFTSADLLYPMAAALVAVACLALCKRLGRGLFAAIAIYAIMVSPSLGFVAFAGMVSTFVADHYFYLGSIPLIVLLVQAGDRVLEKLSQRRPDAEKVLISGQRVSDTGPAGGLSVSPLVAAGALVALGAVSFGQCMVYVPPLRIWQHELQYDKQCFKAYEIMAIHEHDHHHFRRELVYCRKANALMHGADPVANYLLGSYYLKQKHDMPKAMVFLRKSLLADPYQAKAIVKLAYCYEQQGNWTMAVNDLNRGLAMMPGSSRLCLAFGLAQSHLGDTSLAIKAYLDAIACNSHNADAYYNLAITLDQQGRWRRAMKEFRGALALNPRLVKAHYFYGQDLLNHGHPHAAIQQFQTVIALSPDQPGVRNLLARALRAAGHPRRAAAVQASRRKNK